MTRKIKAKPLTEKLIKAFRDENATDEKIREIIYGILGNVPNTKVAIKIARVMVREMNHREPWI